MRRKVTYHPLVQSDPDELWAVEADRRGMTVAQLRAQIQTADKFIDEILAEERAKPKP